MKKGISPADIMMSGVSIFGDAILSDEEIAKIEAAEAAREAAEAALPGETESQRLARLIAVVASLDIDPTH
jgi:hypothetical protein